MHTIILFCCYHARRGIICLFRSQLRKSAPAHTLRYREKAVMTEIGEPLVGFYDYRLVALSIFIAISASYMALDLGGRVTATHGGNRSAWLAGGAAAMGLGIWSMHFTGMLAFNLPVPVFYDWPTVLLSLLAAILASAVALYVVSRKKMERAQALTGSVFMGLGIAGMHYLGMAAMRLPAMCHYSPPLVALSILIAGVASLVAIQLTFDYREDFRKTALAKVVSAAVMGAAIFLMHYTGMWSASFIAATVLPDISHAVSVSSLGLSGIVIGTFVIQGVAIVTSSVDRRFAEQAQELQTSERFRQITENLPIVLALANADFSQLLYVNHAYHEVWGRTPESFYSDPKSFLEGIHPEDRGHVAELVQCLISGQPIDNLECRVVRPDGSISWIVCRGYVVRNAQGQVYRLVGSAIDITKRKRAEEVVKQAEDRIRLIIDTIPTMAWSVRPDGAIDFINQRSLDYAGLSLEEYIEQPTRTIHPEDLPRVMEKWLADMVSGQPSEDEMRLRRADGEYRWFLVRTVPLRDEQGNIVKWYGSNIDIEDRKRAEEALRSSEREQRHIAAQLERERARLVEAQEVSKIGSWEADVKTLDVIWSEQTHRIFETDPSDFHPTRPKFREFIHPEDRAKVDAAFMASLDKGSACTVEYRIVMPDGRVKIVEERWRAFHDEEGKPVRVAGTCRDITERVRAEEELRRLSGQFLRLQDEERRKIAQDLHDSTGQNLVALATMLSQLRSSAPSDERKSRAIISECLGLAEQCIREVRTLSYALYPPELDESGLEGAIRDYVKGFTERSGIQVELQISPSVGKIERNIELALFRVVQESLTNIQRHSGSQQAKIRIDHNSDVTMEVSDLGHGAPAGVRRGKEELRFEIGVGIQSMQERVKLVGGQLEIDSTSQGTTVRVTVPVGGKEREKAAHSDR
jgi:PAS domain S-box-containing protein